MTAGVSGAEGLARLRAMSREALIEVLLGCCACPPWAQRVAEGLAGCSSDAQVQELSERVWWECSPADWRGALNAHPKIGARVAEASREGREQGAMQDAGPALREAIAEGNAAYEQRFGMTYVVRARGRDAAELLLLLRRRLANDPDTELRVAAGEQAEITRLRLADVLSAMLAA